MQNSSKKSIIFWAVIFSVLANVFFSRWITAKISTLPVLNRLHLLDPQSPIVIRETNEVRISSDGEIADNLQKLTSRLSQVGISAKNGFQVLGTAANFTSDGVFVTSRLAIVSVNKDLLQIRLADGRITAVADAYLDEVTGLAFLKTGINSLSVAALADTGALKLGDRLLLYSDSSEGASYFETQVNFLPTDKQRVFGFQDAGVDPEPGMVVANYKGELLGIWHLDLVTPEKIKSAFDNYLESLKK